MLRTRLESCQHPLQPKPMCLAGQLSRAYTLLKHCKENKRERRISSEAQRVAAVIMENILQGPCYTLLSRKANCIQ